MVQYYPRNNFGIKLFPSYNKSLRTTGGGEHSQSFRAILVHNQKSKVIIS